MHESVLLAQQKDQIGGIDLVTFGNGTSLT